MTHEYMVEFYDVDDAENPLWEFEYNAAIPMLNPGDVVTLWVDVEDWDEHYRVKGQYEVQSRKIWYTARGEWLMDRPMPMRCMYTLQYDVKKVDDDL